MLNRLALCAILLVGPAALAQVPLQREVLVLTTATEIAGTAQRRGIEIQNLGPNPIWCAFTKTGAATTTARKIGTGEFWAVEAAAERTIWCVASSANQVSGAATIVSEV